MSVSCGSVDSLVELGDSPKPHEALLEQYECLLPDLIHLFLVISNLQRDNLDKTPESGLPMGITGDKLHNSLDDVAEEYIE